MLSFRCQAEKMVTFLKEIFKMYKSFSLKTIFLEEYFLDNRTYVIVQM